MIIVGEIKLMIKALHCLNCTVLVMVADKLVMVADKL